MNGEPLSTAELALSATLYLGLAAGAGALLWRLYPRIRGPELRPPLALVFGTIIVANAANGGASLAQISGDGPLPVVLTALSLGAAALLVPAFIHMLSWFPRALPRRLARPLILALYGTSGAMLTLMPAGFGPAISSNPQGGIDVSFGPVWGLINGIQSAALLPLVGWLSYLWLRGSSSDERRAARALWMAAGVPILVVVPVILLDIPTDPPFDVITFSYAWWVAAVYLTFSRGKLAFRIIEKPPMFELGQRPQAPRGRRMGSARFRNIAVSGASLAVFLGWLTILNTAIIQPNDSFGRTVYNQASIIVYSVALTVFAFRMGSREARLEQSTWSMLESLPLGLAVLTPDYKVEFANRALLQGLGYKNRDVSGKPASAFLTKEVVAEVSTDHARRAAGQATTYKLRVRTQSGDRHDAIVTLLPYLREGTYDGALAVVNDVSEVVELRKEAEHHSSLAGFLSDAVTHDLSNAMQIALVRVQLALTMSQADGGRLARLLREAQDSMDRSVRLIREVKHIAIAERDNWPRERTPFTVILAEGVEGASGASPKAVRVHVQSSVEGIEVDANALLAVGLTKVLEEAVETRSSPDGEVMVAAKPRDNGVELTVTGSTRAFDGRDFEVLSQGPDGYRWGDTPWRCGIRVALAASILKAHGGSLGAAPGPEGKGTAYTLWIPSAAKAPASSVGSRPEGRRREPVPDASATARLEAPPIEGVAPRGV